MYTASEEILAVVSHHTKKRVIGLQNSAIEVPDEYPDDVGVDQAPELDLALFDLSAQCCQ
jgi:hypothetical protein